MVRDVYDRPLGQFIGQGEPVLIIYANRGTRGSVEGPATELAFRLHDVPFVTVVRADLRGVPGLFHGIARNRMRSDHAAAVQRYVDGYKSRGFAVPVDVSDHLIFVLDENGGPHDRLGLKQGFTQAMALVLDGTGREVLRAEFPQDADRVEMAIRNAASGGSPKAEGRRPTPRSQSGVSPSTKAAGSP